MKTVNTSGKRKRAVARATLTQGSGIIRVNNTLIEHYQPAIMKMKLMEPLLLADEISGKVDVEIDVRGGGITSQTDAARLAMAKALVEYSKNDKLKAKFSDYDWSLLVADVRRKETRKPNRHGKARAKVQKSYR